MHVDAHFDSGNIEVVAINGGANGPTYQEGRGGSTCSGSIFTSTGLAIRRVPLIINAGDASYPKA